jgi:myo-inositol-1(or 4)-monophosphatase
VAFEQPLWVVDPLDGTTNFVHDVPMYVVSIGLVVEGKAVVGVIYDPNRNEMYSACHGVGASLNGQALKTSVADSLAASLVSVGFPADWRGKNEILQVWGWFGCETQGLRRTGSSALNLAYVAAGRFDGFFAFQICPWDVAAGIILVEEAGGRITRCVGSPYDVLSGDWIVASNGPLHGELLRGLRTLG